MTATKMAEANLTRNVEMANRFVERVESMSSDERARIATDSFGSSAHTSAMLATADEITTQKNRDREGKLTAFLVEAEGRIDALHLDTQVAGLVKGAVRAILVHDLPDRDRATRQLYSAFEGVIPFVSLSEGLGA
jgi:hypothetical protein